MEIETIFITGVLNIMCFVIGALFGAGRRDRKDVLKTKFDPVYGNPLEAVKKRGEKKAAERENKRFNTILQNIEAYNGTEAGQVEVPRR